MKKLIGLVAVLMLFSIALVSAGSIEDLNYKDKYFFGIIDENRQTDDYDVTIDADTLSGKTVDELGGTTNNYNGGGMTSGRLSKYLSGFTDVFEVYDNFVDYLKTMFVTKTELENTNLRIDKLEARINLGPDATDDELTKEALVIGADRRGEDLIINGMKCVNGICIKVG